ncbi:MAG TPA: hypothetical protein VGQ83_24650 [Polyangia bacterium]
MPRCLARPLAALTLAALAGCGAAPGPAPACPQQHAVGEKLTALTREIDVLVGRYDALLKQNQAIEKLLGDLGFKVEMTGGTVQQRVEMMHRFERAEASRTATFQKLRRLLATLASQHTVETYVEVRAGQIVVRLAERALFDAKGAFRAEAAPLVWAVAEGLKELPGRFEIAAEVAVAAAAPVAAAAAVTGMAKRKARPARARTPKGPPPPSPWTVAAGRAAEVLRLLEGTGLAGARLAATARLPEQPGGAPFIEILVLPLRDELPRVHGATDTAAPRR